MDCMNHLIRAVRADEWAEVKELRLVALQDPAAPVAFLDSYEHAVERPDSFWQERAAGSMFQNRATSRQFIAEAPDGSWSGTVAVVIEPAGTEDFAGATVGHPQGHLVGVFVRPEHRGRGLLGALVEVALDWAWSLDEPKLERVRLFVHEHNPRAQAAYRKIHFVPSGVTVLSETDPSVKELEFAVERP
jgi:RimJ/RimL family protein N-acetyltransferase